MLLYLAYSCLHLGWAGWRCAAWIHGPLNKPNVVRVSVRLVQTTLGLNL